VPSATIHFTSAASGSPQALILALYGARPCRRTDRQGDRDRQAPHTCPQTMSAGSTRAGTADEQRSESGPPGGVHGDSPARGTGNARERCVSHVVVLTTHYAPGPSPGDVARARGMRETSRSASADPGLPLRLADPLLMIGVRLWTAR
jgi:hypothetical protein